MKWIVTNALSRDVEREHLNKILQDIKANVDGTSSSVETINTIVNNTVLKAFTLELAGDVTGSVDINGSGTFTLEASLAEEYISDVADAKYYLRTLGSWKLATTKLVKEDTNLYFTADRAAEAVVNAINAGTFSGITAEYNSGTINLTIARQTYQSPLETPDGVITVFTAPSEYQPGTMVVTLNGLVEPITEIDSTTFEFVDPPLSTDTIYLDYF